MDANTIYTFTEDDVFTCPICGSRADFNQLSHNDFSCTCLNKSCNFKFKAEIESD